MNHIEEHILELYVLGSKKAEEKRSEIEAHLKECAGCGALVEEIASFYKDADVEFNTLQKSQASEKKALVRVRPHVTRHQEDFSTPMPFIHSTPIGRLRYFVIKHPVAASGGVFGFGAAAVMALTLLTSAPAKDPNPAKFQYNLYQGTLDIYNKRNDKLWQLPAPEVFISDSSDLYFQKHTVIYDLDKDGQNEILTNLNMAGEVSPNRSLRIYDFKQDLLLKRKFRYEFKYLSRTYTPDFGIDQVFVGDLVTRGSPEIFLSAANNPRSPSFLARLDSRYQEIGKYWLFGHINGLDTVDVDNDGKVEIVFWGINDTEDTTHQEFGVIVVLDPSKIVGDGRSTTAPGFAFEESGAEIFYIKLPRSDIDEVRHMNSGINGMERGTDNSLTFSMGTDVRFHYSFSTTMGVIDVKSNNATDGFYASLAEQGKVRGKIDDAYLENLKKGVRYWHGKEWRKEVVRVNHEIPLSTTNGQ